MNIVIAGASGLIGRHLLQAFINKNHKITALSRNPQQQKSQKNVVWKQWLANDASDWKDDIEAADIVINLVGESLAAKRWTSQRKELLLKSRVDACNLFAEVLRGATNKPALFLQSSAIGYYDAADEINETSAAGNDFLARLTKEWEQASEAIEQMGINRILLRTGIVLADESLIIKKFKLPFNLFMGGHLGDGQQIMSWIHIEDVINSILFVITNVKSSQIFNLTAPNPVSMKEFCQKFGKKLKRPSWLHVPAIILKILFGQVAKETMLKGSKILPQNLQKMDYKFTYDHIEAALNNMKSL